MTDTCNFNWHIASSDNESFIVSLALPLSPIIQCGVNSADNTASYVTYRSNKFTKSEAALCAMRREAFISCWTQFLNRCFGKIAFVMKDLAEFLLCRK